MATLRSPRVLSQAYWLPNLLTTFNLICGLLAVVLALEETSHRLPGSSHPLYLAAAWLILAAMVFDYLDGKVARWAHATSEFGMKIDSLTDFVSFGIAPFLLVYRVLLTPVTPVLQVLAGGAFLAAGAWRLARFNCEATGELHPSGAFCGLPIPAAAAFLASMVLIYPGEEATTPLRFLTRSLSSFPPEVVGLWTLLMILLLAYLMVSRIPFPSFKYLNQRTLVVLGGGGLFLAVLLLVLPLSIIMFLLMLIYVLFGLFHYFIGRVLRLQPRRGD
jgi:CDP-diacylglycerol---serine O-phosphatidyltransferase